MSLIHLLNKTSVETSRRTRDQSLTGCSAARALRELGKAGDCQCPETPLGKELFSIYKKKKKKTFFNEYVTLLGCSLQLHSAGCAHTIKQSRTLTREMLVPSTGLPTGARKLTGMTVLLPIKLFVFPQDQSSVNVCSRPPDTTCSPQDKLPARTNTKSPAQGPAAASWG